MGTSVGGLDKSGWTDGAQRRLAKVDQWKAAARARAAWDASPDGERYREALANHPWRGLLDEQVGEASMAKLMEDRWYFQAWNAGNGHREAIGMRMKAHPQSEVDRAIRRDLAWMVPRGMGDREKSVASAAQRAKKEVRRLCKVMNVDSLWTLTYRANVQDRELVLKHLDAFRRRVAVVLGGWAYVGVLERQERGAYHIHLATHALAKHLYPNGTKVKSWEVMRRIWRDVVGDLGGNFDEAKREHWWKPGAKHARSCGAIASYIAGYVAKDMLDGELNRKRYSASRGYEVPEALKACYAADEATMHSLIVSCYSSIGDRVTRSWFDKDRGVFYVESDDTGQRERSTVTVQ